MSARCSSVRSSRGAKARRRGIAALGAALLTLASLASAQPPGAQLGPAPRVTDLRELPVGPAGGAGRTIPAVDRTNRQAVVDLYNSVFVPALAVPNDWSGSVSGCNPGSTSAAYADATLDMVNYFRVMTGLPGTVTHEAVKDGKAQQAALMMTANNQLSHTPPPSWNCYTAEGAEAAGKSNLALGYGAAGASSIALYMSDPGATNTAVGHRRWILYPPQVEMGTGSTSNANDLWVIGTFGARPAAPDVVAWPPAGFVPYRVVYPRWSFSLNSASRPDFTNATVSMTAGGQAVTLTVFPQAVGYGDNTLGWETSGLSFPAGAADAEVLVQIGNVLVGGVPTTYSYTVTVIDPARVPPPVFTDDPLVAGLTRVKAAHVIELRQAIDALRTRFGLGAFAWTDITLSARSTVVKAQHVLDLRNALTAAYTAAKKTPPAFARPLVAQQTTVAAADIAELRTAVRALW